MLQKVYAVKKNIFVEISQLSQIVEVQNALQ